MDALCTPTIATASLFVALVFLDLFRHEYKLLYGHIFFGLLSVLLMSVLCQYGSPMIAWGLLALPFVILFIGLGIQASAAMPLPPAYPTVPFQTIIPCKNCNKKPCRCPILKD
jgi:hypothetical protein